MRKQDRNFRKMRLTSLAALSITGLMAGLTTEAVYAVNGWEEDLSDSEIGTIQTNASVQLTMSGKSIQGTLDAANAATNPDEAGKVLTETATITVGNTDGYTVAVSGNASLTGRNNSARTIPSVSSNKTLGNMRNEWGYYGVLGDTEATWNPSTSFKAMTTGQQTVGTGGATTSNVTKKVTLFYGARVDGSIAEDFYGNTVTLSVVAQPRTVTTTVTKFGGITKMQEMTASICNAAAVNDTAQLIDTRDNKKYWVTKLLDGNCWMSQNLSLDITTSNITTTSSDVTSDWTTSSKYPPTTTSHGPIYKSGGGGYESNTTYSWNLGNWVYNTPLAGARCENTTADLSACKGYGFVDVSNYTASSEPNFYRKTTYKGADDTTNCTKAANTAVSTATSGACAQYDAHYSVGNYYQWNAAVAGTGLAGDGKQATGSVCPKGWKLPTFGSSATENQSYYKVLQQYGVKNGAAGIGEDGKAYDIALSPLFFVRQGLVQGSQPASRVIGGEGASGYLNGVGSSGDYWTSESGTLGGLAMQASFPARGDASSGGVYQLKGMAVRCVAQ